MSLLDVARQVVGALRIRNGGTGNAYGWGAAVVAQYVNRSGASMPLGSVVYVSVSGGITLAASAPSTNVAGVIVGYYANGDINNLVVGAVANGGAAAVMLAGVCRVLTSADVTVGNYAKVGGTPGSAVDSATAATGAFGRFTQNGVVATRPLVWCRLFGAATEGVVTVLTGGVDIIFNSPIVNMQADLEMPFAGTLTGWTLLADASGSCVVDIWKDVYGSYPPTVADTITAAAKPTIAAATKGQSSTLTGWTTAFATGDIIRLNVDSVSGIARVVLSLKFNRS